MKKIAITPSKRGLATLAPGLLVTRCADEVIDPKEATKQMRASGDMMLTSINSLLDCLEEPLKGKFLDVKKQINVMLAGLPDSDKAPAALDANGVLRQLLYVMATAQSMMTSLSDTAKAANSQIISTRASLTTEVESAIQKKITAGELMTKASHEAGVNDAKTVATNAVRETIKTEATLAKSRRELITKAGLPAPGDEKLVVGDEAAFTARQAEVKTRHDLIKPLGLPAERMVTLCWDYEKVQFDDTIALLKTVASSRTPAGQQRSSLFLKTEGDKTTDSKTATAEVRSGRLIGAC